MSLLLLCAVTHPPIHALSAFPSLHLFHVIKPMLSYNVRDGYKKRLHLNQILENPSFFFFHVEIAMI